MSMSQTGREFNTLKAKIAELGLDRRSPIRVWSELAFAVAMFGAGAIFHEDSLWLAIILASIGGITLVWWIHDAGHDAFFSSRKKARFWIESTGILFLGMPQIEYHFEVHRKHHGFTNIIGKDGALDTGPVLWHAKQITEKRTRPLRFQNWLWFIFILPLTWPLITLRCVRTLWERREYLRLTAFTLRWMLVPILLNFNWAFILIPILVTGFVLGFSASLNHFHMSMDTAPTASFPTNVFFNTQNLSNRSRFVTWLTGGLNFHLEHHLFPTLPSSQLRKISPLVEEFARSQGLPYQVCTAGEATEKLFNRLSEPFASSNGFSGDFSGQLSDQAPGETLALAAGLPRETT